MEAFSDDRPPIRSDSSREVVLTNEAGAVIGTEDTLKAHQDGGRLHRAFSIFVFNDRKETLLQLRASTKRSFPGLWSNTCCGHPAPGRQILAAARQRLLEEMGFTVSLREVGRLTYRATDQDSGLTEREYDHLFTGFYQGVPRPDPSEAAGWKWVRLDVLFRDLFLNPGAYTPWLPSALGKLTQTPERATRLRYQGRRPI